MVRSRDQYVPAEHTKFLSKFSSNSTNSIEEQMKMHGAKYGTGYCDAQCPYEMGMPVTQPIFALFLFYMLTGL